jgi:hypothetical protein
MAQFVVFNLTSKKFNFFQKFIFHKFILLISKYRLLCLQINSQARASILEIQAAIYSSFQLDRLRYWLTSF